MRILCSKIAETYLRASINSKFSRVIPPGPPLNRGGKRGDRNGKEKMEKMIREAGTG
jgi:hypothetical protein